MKKVNLFLLRKLIFLTYQLNIQIFGNCNIPLNKLCDNADCQHGECAMISDERKFQLREAQRRRRAKLAAGKRSQVNIFLTQNSKELIEQFCHVYQTDKHVFINALITAFAISPNSLLLEINK